jgi:hypothetical protein
MKLISSFSVLNLVCFSLLIAIAPASAETDYACKRDAVNNAIIIDSSKFGDDSDPGQDGIQPSFVEDIQGNLGGSCKEVPDAYKVTFYRMAMCKANPILNSNSLDGCTLLLNDNAGVEHVIEGTGNSAVLDTSSADTPIANGSYSFLALVLSNALQIKHSDEYILEDGNPADILGATGQGQYCWTNDAITTFTGTLLDADYPAGTIVSPNPNDRFTLGMDCGSTPGVAQYTTEIIDSLGDGPGFVASEVGYDDSILLTSNNETTATTAANATRIMVALPITAEVTSSSQFDLKFTLTRAVSVDLHLDIDSSEVTAVKNGADPFDIALTVTN